MVENELNYVCRKKWNYRPNVIRTRKEEETQDEKNRSIKNGIYIIIINRIVLYFVELRGGKINIIKCVAAARNRDDLARINEINISITYLHVIFDSNKLIMVKFRLKL